MKQRVSLYHWRFLSFLAAQFLGAFNDNAFKLVVSMAALSLILDPAAQQGYLAITSALAILPFLLFSGYAGYFADRYTKSSVLRISKAAEILAMLAALFVFVTGQEMDHLLITLFLLATHSAFFSPSKYSILPEILSAGDLPKANGYVSMLTFVAIILGSLSGATLWGAFKHQPEIIGLILTGIAMLGTVLCLFVPQSAPGNAAKKFALNPFGEIIHGATSAGNNRVLLACMFGSAVFWMLGALIYLAIIVLGKTQLGLSEGGAGSLFAFLAGGIAVGSVLAGHIVGRSVRRTVSVWGALILSLGCGAAGLYATNYAAAATLMAIIGFGGGLFIVPVVTLLQKHAPEALRGQMLATSGFFDMVGVLLASGLFWLFGTQLHLSPSSVIVAAGGIAFIGLFIAILLAPRLLFEAAESAIFFLTRRIYRIRLVGDGLDNGRFPQPKGPTVFIANHVTYLDGLLISALSPRPIRYLVLSTFWKNPLTRFVLNAMGAIPFGTGKVGETRHGLDAARKALAAGEYVCIFPEGVLTRTGHLHPFKRGIEKMLEGTEAQIMPIYLERLWGSIFSFSGKRFFKKLPRTLPYPVTITVGSPLPANTPAWKLNRVISELGTQATPYRYGSEDTLGRRFIVQAKRRLFAERMADTIGQRVNGLQALVGARLIARWLKPKVTGAQNVAVLLPSSVGGALANIALALLGKTSVNLNVSLGRELMNETVAQADARHILTSRIALKKLNILADERMLYVEDALGGGRLKRAIIAAQALLLPASLLQRCWLKGVQQKEAPATILFSSGSTARPKAVMLSHANLIANIESVHDLLVHAESDEPKAHTLAGILPFFHSFGLTACLWLPAITGRRVVYHLNPLESKKVVSMLESERIGILVATPTFAQHYATAAKPHALDRLRMLLLGGEKLMASTEARLTELMTNTNILQGYGTTELGPVVSINVPDIRHAGLLHRGYAKGSVGKPIPGVSVRIVHAETFVELAPAEEGLILVKSPSRMQSYYGDPDRTGAALHEGWYITGDIGHIDKDGFLFITDRSARFSKIGGEMVPHGKIEAALQAITGAHAESMVVAISGEDGERLVILTTQTALPNADLRQQLKQQGLPNLWIPRAEHIFHVDALPTSATGKRDLRTAADIARQLLQHKS